MGTTDSRQRALSAPAFWRGRNGQLRQAYDELMIRVARTQEAQTAILQASVTAKLNETPWTALLNEGKTAFRLARVQKRKVFKLVCDDRDTLRIRPAYSEAVPVLHLELLDKARAYVDLIEGMGY